MRASLAAAPSLRTGANPAAAAGLCGSGDHASAAAGGSRGFAQAITCRQAVRAGGSSGQRPTSTEKPDSSRRQRPALPLQQGGRVQSNNIVKLGRIKHQPHPQQAEAALVSSAGQRREVEQQAAPAPTQQQAGGAVREDEQAVVVAVAAAAATAAATASSSRVGSGGFGSRTEASSLDGMHKPVTLVVGSAWLMAAAVQLTGAAALSPLWLPAVAGGMLGGAATALNHLGERRLWRSPSTPLRVMIIGGTKGIGKALAREFLRSGDRVLVTSRSLEGAQEAVEQLRQEVGPHVDIMGVDCDISSPVSVDRLMEQADALMGGCDVSICNAGYSGSFQSFLEQSPEQIQRVVQTNLLGSLLTTRAAMRYMAQQPGGGHIFNMEGAGSDGSATPKYAAYGATKSGIAQLLKTLQHEAAGLPNPVCVHNLSPGMVLTDLLLEGTTNENKQIFNILCEQPETVAAFLVPRARSVVARGQAGAAIRFLTPLRALSKFLTAPMHLGKYFDREGRPVYLPERERLLGERARRTKRLQQAAASRSQPLRLAYSLSMAVSFWLIVSDALAKAPIVPGQ